ncbi:hypothetical protein ACFWOJ_17925 [Streptomyces sp. NPDC058439]|uniref:hypothetical protein n=1 Tax=Streptomyces sp. NPDC058439 TaxID=3346500 RepID=UPI003667567E
MTGAAPTACGPGGPHRTPRTRLRTEVTGRPGPRVASLLGTLTPNFGYVSGRTSIIGFPRF